MAKHNSKGAGTKPSKWGRGKTDPESWWKKGDPSPNPKGRPKGSKNQKTKYKDAVSAKITVNLDGVEKTMTKGELAYHQLAQKAAAGDLKAFALLKELDEKYDPAEAAPPTPEESMADYQTLEAWIELREKFKVLKEAEDPQPASLEEDDDHDSDEADYGEDDDGEEEGDDD